MLKRIRGLVARLSRPRQRAACRLAVEVLESRTVLSPMALPTHLESEHRDPADLPRSHFEAVPLATELTASRPRMAANFGPDVARIDETWASQPTLMIPIFPAGEIGAARPATPGEHDQDLFAMPERAAVERHPYDFAEGERSDADRQIVEISLIVTQHAAPWPARQLTADAANTPPLLLASHWFSAIASPLRVDLTTRASNNVAIYLLIPQANNPLGGIRSDLLSLRTPAESEGGLVFLGTQHPEPIAPRSDPLPAGRVRPPVQPTDAQLRNLGASDGSNTIRSGKSGLSLPELARPPMTTSLLERPTSTAEASSSEEGGLLRLSIEDVVATATRHANGNFALPAQSGSVPSPASTRAEPRSWDAREGLPNTGRYDLDGALNANGSPERVRATRADGAMEGGLIDVGAGGESSPSLLDKASSQHRQATSKLPWKPSAEDHTTLLPQAGDRADGADSSADRHDRPAESTEVAGDCARGSAGVVAGEEGGMIVLVSAAIPAFELSPAEAGLPAALRPAAGQTAPSLGDGEIRLDTGVGLYQVFELATAPGQLTDQPDSRPAASRQADPPVHGAASASGKHGPSGGDSDASDEVFTGKLVRVAAAVPAVLLLASLPVVANRRSQARESQKAGTRSGTQ